MEVMVWAINDIIHSMPGSNDTKLDECTFCQLFLISHFTLFNTLYLLIFKIDMSILACIHFTGIKLHSKRYLIWQTLQKS